KLVALLISARQGCRRLSQRDITQPDIKQCLQFAGNHGHRTEKFSSMLHRHLQNFGDIFAFVLNFKRFAVVALAMTNVAGHVNIRKKMHLDLDDTVTLTSLAASAFHIERKTSGRVSPLTRLRHTGEQFPDWRKK